MRAAIEAEADPGSTTLAIAAEVARVNTLSTAEQAALGREFTDPEAIFMALEALGPEVTVLVRASWLKKQKPGFVLPERPDLPDEAIIDSDELSQIWRERRLHRGAKRALPWCFCHLDKKILLNRLKSAAPRYRALTTWIKVFRTSA